jgi:hypothetical protein
MASAIFPTILPCIRIRVTTSSVMAASKPLYSRREPSNSDSGYTQFNWGIGGGYFDVHLLSTERAEFWQWNECLWHAAGVGCGHL